MKKILIISSILLLNQFNTFSQTNVFPSGNVGFGTSSPKNQLDVNGGIAVGSFAGSSTAPANSLIVSDNVGIGTATPNTSSALEINSTTKGILIPRMLESDRITLAGIAVDGLLIYQTNTTASSVSGFYYFDGTTHVWKQINSGSGAGGWSDYAVIKDVENFATGSGTAPLLGKWNQRTLNTISKPTGSGISLSGNNVTVPAGTYYIKASAPGYRCNATKIILKDNSNNVLLTGTSEFDFWFNNGTKMGDNNSVQVRSFAEGVLTFANTTTFGLFQWFEFVETNNVNTLGFRSKATDGTIQAQEVYSQVLIQKIK